MIRARCGYSLISAETAFPCFGQLAWSELYLHLVWNASLLRRRRSPGRSTLLPKVTSSDRKGQVRGAGQFDGACVSGGRGASCAARTPDRRSAAISAPISPASCTSRARRGSWRRRRATRCARSSWTPFFRAPSICTSCAIRSRPCSRSATTGGRTPSARARSGRGASPSAWARSASRACRPTPARPSPGAPPAPAPAPSSAPPPPPPPPSRSPYTP
jgi:hypothetical protein